MTLLQTASEDPGSNLHPASPTGQCRGTRSAYNTDKHDIFVIAQRTLHIMLRNTTI
ncbi:hypothetical protein BPY_13500 [Bifidobacterium psychraerophilum]